MEINAPQLTRRLVNGLRAGGVRWLVEAIGHRVIPPRPAMRSAVIAAVINRKGLEIGGPSRLFEARRLLPIYPVAERVDNVNFSDQTAWEHNLRDNGDFRFDSKRATGVQWIRDAVALADIPNECHDFVLSSHCLEHVANPLLALHEWRRVTKSGGHLILILPDPIKTFDHRRPITTLDHLREDFGRGAGEDDQTHVSEVLALHDLLRDPWAGSVKNFRERVANNATNRCIHHHVFDTDLMTSALTETGWKVLSTERARPLHLIAFATKG